MEHVPADLLKALKSDVAAHAQWKGLTPIARRDFATWIVSAKKEETRAKRVEKARSMLVAGKRRPCCYAVVPLGLYRAIGADAVAKARWGALTPDERRDFADWVDADSALRERRIEKACTLLRAGKRRPA